MALKQKSGIAVGLNKGHVNVLCHKIFTALTTVSESYPTRGNQTQDFAYERSSEQENCIRKRDRERSRWVCTTIFFSAEEIGTGSIGLMMTFAQARSL